MKGNRAKSSIYKNHGYDKTITQTQVSYGKHNFGYIDLFGQND